jgi:hypothetical protein
VIEKQKPGGASVNIATRVVGEAGNCDTDAARLEV